MNRELRKYEEQLVREIEKEKFLSWKQLWKAIQLNSIIKDMNH